MQQKYSIIIIIIIIIIIQHMLHTGSNHFVI